MDYNVLPISTRQCLYKCLYRRIIGSCPLLYWNYSNFTKKIRFVFLQELDKIPNYPRSEYQLQIFNEIKDHKILYFAITIYFFIMRTLALFAIIE